MQTPQRQLAPSVIQRLLAEPQRFQFMQAVRLLVRWLGQHGIPPDQALNQVLRFQNSVSLNFPASQIEALHAESGTPVETESELGAAMQAQQLSHIRVTPAFIGFLGANGALPYHYTEHVGRHLPGEQGQGARAFFDLFSQRSVALFYQAWCKHRPEQQRNAEGGDGFLRMLLALGGIREDTRSPLDQRVAGFYAALFRQRPVSASMMESVLSEYFDVPIALEQFVGAWDRVPESDRSRLGGPNAVLGESAMLGVRRWRRDLRVRLNIGPLDKAAFERFLPRASGTKALERMLGMFGVAALEYEARLILRAQCIEPTLLGGGKRQGWDAFLVAKTPTSDRNDVRFMLHPS